MIGPTPESEPRAGDTASRGAAQLIEIGRAWVSGRARWRSIWPDWEGLRQSSGEQR